MVRVNLWPATARRTPATATRATPTAMISSKRNAIESTRRSSPRPRAETSRSRVVRGGSWPPDDPQDHASAGFQSAVAGFTMRSMTTTEISLPDYAPVPRSALGPALNDQGYYVGRVERNLYWVTDG